MAHTTIGLLLVAVTSMACSGENEHEQMDGEETTRSESNGASTNDGSTQSSRGMARGMGAIVGSSISTGGAGGGEGMSSSGTGAAGTDFAAGSAGMSPASGAESGSQSGEAAEEEGSTAMGDPQGMAEEPVMMAADTTGDPQDMAEDQAMMAASAMTAAEDMMNTGMAMEDAAAMDGAGAADDSASAGESPMVCATYFEGISSMNAPGAEVMPNPGSWGQLPELLHSLPAGAQLCGAYSVGGVAEFVAIASAADGAALRAHYDPILTGAGCSFFLETPVADAVSYAYTCPPEVGGVVSIATSAGDIGVYLLSAMAL